MRKNGGVKTSQKSNLNNDLADELDSSQDADCRLEDDPIYCVCGSTEDSWFSRTVPMGYFCPDCGGQRQ